MAMLSFSTMWAQQLRFDDLGYFRAVVASYGYEAIEVSHSTSEPGLRALLDGGASVRVSSLHAPTPFRLLDGRANGEANLASTDEDQRRVAIEETKRTVEFAGEAGLPFVVVHLGGVGDRRTNEERALRALYEAGERTGARWDAAQSALWMWRAERARAYLECASRSLEELVELASRRGVAIGIESRLSYHEIPLPEEAVSLLTPYDNSVAGFWYDVGHCEVQSRLGMIDHALWGLAVGQRIIGSHLHDVNGIVDHRAPGNGTLDWELVRSNLPPEALRVLEIDQHEPDESVAAAGGFLQERGIV
jgi:sugar phosphate isomerase/epimerase